LKAAACLWWLSCLPEAAAFWRATGRVQTAQRQALQRILSGSQASDFGRRYRLSAAMDPDDFRSRVPFSDYEDYREAVERIAAGEQGVLRSEPVRLLEPTSGTRGGAKLIPYTATLKAEFQRGVAPWMANLLTCRPTLLGGRHYWSISPPAGPRERTAGGLPVGFDDDVSYLSSWSGRLVRSLMAVPAGVLTSPDFQTATLEHLVSCRDLVMVSVWSPTFWLLLLERLQEEPARIWPQLSCISCWGDGFSARYLEPLARLHPGVWIQKKGLIATEGFCTFPLVGYPGAALALRSHFFEFLDPQGRSHLAHQIGAGIDYEIVLTTGGGLYRYRLGDFVRVEGYFRECPLLSFQGRGGGVVDRFGEKLSEAEVGSCLAGEGLAFVAYEPHLKAYTLFAQGSDDALRGQVQALEAALRHSNFHYDQCRQLGQLNPLAVFALDPGALAAYYARLQAGGIRLGDLKPLALRPEDNWSRSLPGQFVPV
jgi:hypothetical protein